VENYWKNKVINFKIALKEDSMKHRRFVKLILFLVMIAVLLPACSGKEGSGDKPVKITFFNTSAEVNSMFEEMFEKYHELNPNVTIELIPTAVGEGQQEKLQSLYASGNAPTIMNVDPANVIEYSDKLYEFSMERETWLKQMNDGCAEAGTFGGKLQGVAYSVQGYGLLYNKRVVDSVYGEGKFDPKSINTRDALKAFLEKIEAAGIPATMLHGANWSLGGHYLTLTYACQGPATSDGTGFIDKLKDGTQKIQDSPIFQGYMDTLDLLVEHNYNKADPLVADYNKDVQNFGEGKCATFFMGDWSWTVMSTLEGVDTEYGFIPVPWSNNPDDYGNTQVVMVLPKFMAIDKSNNTTEQQQAAVKFLEWMLTKPEGQKFFLDAGFCMPYRNISDDITYNSMTTSIANYAKEGKTINLGCFSYITGDAWTETGNLMLKYITKAINRDQLAEGINSYWQSVK